LWGRLQRSHKPPRWIEGGLLLRERRGGEGKGEGRGKKGVRRGEVERRGGVELAWHDI